MPLEKLYVHIDQTTFYRGERLSFSIHAVNGNTNRYDSTLSATAYLEIIDERDSILVRKVTHLESGRSHGILNLDALDINKTYRLRSYTNWMHNLGPQGYFEQHFAIVEYDKTASWSRRLPESKTEYTSQFMQLSSSNPEWIQLQFDQPEPDNNRYMVVVEAQQHIIYSAVVSTPRGCGELAIHKKKIPKGYFRIAVINTELDIIDELVAFNNYESFNYELGNSHVVREKRKKGFTLIALRDRANDPIRGQFSIAVRHKEPLGIYRWSMQDFFGLRYQNSQNTSHGNTLNWLDLSGKARLINVSEYRQLERTMVLSGIAKQSNGKPSASTLLNVFINGQAPFYAQTKTDVTGRFAIDNIFFEQEADIVLSDNKNRALDYIIFPIWSSAPEVISNYEVILLEPKSLRDTDYSIEILEDAFEFTTKDDILLEEIEIKANKTREDIKKGVARLYGTSEITIDEATVNFQSGIYDNIFEIIAGRVTSYLPPPAGGPAGRFRRVTSLRSATDPLCLLNGVPTNCKSLEHIPIQTISSIDVSPKALTMFGGAGSNGMIAVYTIAAEPRKLAARDVNPTAYTFSVEGYHPQDLPEMPDYSTKLPQHVKPDYRRTLYWNPSVPTDDFGSLYIPFYMNDLPELDYIVEVEGVDDSGRVVSLQVPLFQDDN
ncbi:MAG: hypothetical protein AAGC88_07360 [Bacteroidota bacterium]